MRIPTFAYLFRRDFENPGDLYSCPIHYLVQENSGILIDVVQPQVPKIDVDVLIVGGGALFTAPKFIDAIKSKIENINAKYKVIWGADLNPDTDRSILNGYDLIGIRHNGLEGLKWVPCVSVMHEALWQAKDVKPYKGLLVVDHWKRPIEVDMKHTRMKNKPASMFSMIEAIAQHKYVVTTSYHVAYWATLLNRKVIVSGTSLPTKFYGFRHPPLIVDKFEPHHLAEAKNWENAYSECLTYTENFRRKLENLVGVPVSFRHPEFTVCSR